MRLREFRQDDIPHLVKHALNYNVARYLTSKFPYPYRIWWINSGSKNGIHKAVEHNGECIGGIGIINGEGEHIYAAHIGYWLGELHWGKGIATKALSIMTEEVFAKNNIVRLEALVFSPNKASMRVLEKCEYKFEGIKVKAAFKNDTFLDEYVYAKISA
jgi:[ribosomal protein S5]-alanine N-acetyltransferase